MDYHSIHGYDRASFGTPSTHRLPTVSASQALDELGNDASTHVSIGIEELDRSLIANIPVDSQDTTAKGGVQRGQVTEIWGPPGAGKTALGLQLTANALCDGDAVVWHDRLRAVTNATKTRRNCQTNSALDASETQEGDASRFYHYSCFTLPHLVALVSRPTAKLIPHNCSLMVISSLSALVNSALPKSHDGKATSKSNKGPSPSAKRTQALLSIVNALHKFAATRNCAVVVLSQCATKMHSERGATLTAAVNASVWEQGISTRLVMFRDWAWQENNLTSVFLAGLQKLDGKACQEVVENVVAFKVELDGVSQVPYEALQTFELARHKRKLGQTELEVPDSEDDEDYGWADEDEAAMPAPPPQWQGSEDLILGQDIGQSEDENSEQEEPVTDDESIMK
ncbi:DNA recombination and repair protein Rad51-like, C-terminal [Fusarium oxysporum f. sp. vasinfectum]|nr:DNA recombination and repair protein Rad51-like, C-terminal [Fusarium oxysporum f. sp. vasinfectum]KAK2932449.1 DNA recombination and repair protein Rad51-like, C-terminal [Fusarium oxysporum f. sp. vasinfectum]